jgi:hypothetical protein
LWGSGNQWQRCYGNDDGDDRHLLLANRLSSMSSLRPRVRIVRIGNKRDGPGPDNAVRSRLVKKGKAGHGGWKAHRSRVRIRLHMQQTRAKL